MHSRPWESVGPLPVVLGGAVLYLTFRGLSWLSDSAHQTLLWIVFRLWMLPDSSFKWCLVRFALNFLNLEWFVFFYKVILISEFRFRSCRSWSSRWFVWDWLRHLKRGHLRLNNRRFLIPLWLWHWICLSLRINLFRIFISLFWSLVFRWSLPCPPTLCA